MQLIGSDKLTVIVGLGVTGLSCARYLSVRGVNFAAVDSRSQPPGEAEFRERFPDAMLHTGDFDTPLFERATELVVNPGISLHTPAIAAAAERGAAVLGDIELFARAAKAPIVAITGSNGKSTVTTLVGEMAKAAGKRVAVGGNLGTAALDILDDSVELYVVELSSFQLERCSQLGAEVAVVLNISEDHLDHHGSLVAYHQAKHRIFQGCAQAVINRDDRLSEPLIPDAVKRHSFSLRAPDWNGFGLSVDGDGVEQLAFGQQLLLPVSALKMAGRHNVANVLAALALGNAAGLPMTAMLTAVTEFTGLPHRCEFVAEHNRVRYYNDSKATNVGSAVAALEGLATGMKDTSKLVLIAGGRNKGADLSPLCESASQLCRAVVLIGEAADEMAECLEGSAIGSFDIAASMAQAVELATAKAEPGDAVLLAPACASFDMFDNYLSRGDSFKSAVQAIAGEAA